jgi:F-type H+-transporting ATPase subunit delta
LVDSHRGIVSVQVRSAVPLTEEEKERLSEVLARSLRKQVRLETSVDSSLIGGVVLRIGDRLLDGSVKGQLNLLRQRLIGRMTSA